MTDRRASRRHLLLLLCAGALPATRARAETALPRPVSLAAAARSAAARDEPLVLLVSLPGCPYCEQVRRSHLAPLERQGASVWQLDIGSLAAVIDFDGTRRSHDAVISALGARFAPTVLFLGARGEELGERLVGAGIPDFYGAMLEERLQLARARTARR